MNSGIVTGLLIPFAGTALGSAFVFFMRREMPTLLQKALLGFASGVMVAASVWSLLIPGMDLAGGNVWPVLLGLLAGFAFLLLIDYITPHLHASGEEEGPRSSLSKTVKLALAVTIHNLPEGMAVGIVLAGAMTADGGMSMAGALALSLGIAIQNVPEGAIISMPLRAAGNSRWKAFWVGAASGIVEPIGGALVLLLASTVIPAMPYLLAFAAGAMLYVVVEELIPDASEGEHSNLGTIGFALGFALMMVLDVLLG
jgi:ZIP family zinc transporter